MLQLTADEFLDLIGSDLGAVRLSRTHPTEVVADGEMVVSVALHPMPAGVEAQVVEGVNTSAYFVNVTEDLFRYLTEALR